MIATLFEALSIEVITHLDSKIVPYLIFSFLMTNESHYCCIAEWSVKTRVPLNRNGTSLGLDTII